MYKYRLHRTLNLVFPARVLRSGLRLIVTDFASFRRAMSKKSLISLISFGILLVQTRDEWKI